MASSNCSKTTSQFPILAEGRCNVRGLAALVLLGWIMAESASPQAAMGAPPAGRYEPQDLGMALSIPQAAPDQAPTVREQAPAHVGLTPRRSPVRSASFPRTKAVQEPPIEQLPQWHEPGLAGQELFVEEPTIGMPCPGGCPAYWYANAEILELRREDGLACFGERANLISLMDLDPDYTCAMRVTVGRQRDCLDAWEICGTAVDQWEYEDSLVATTSPLLSPVLTVGVNIETFRDAMLHSVAFSSELHSLEFNHRQSAWGVVSSLFGVRYLNLEEEFEFFSIDSDLETGELSIDTGNQLFGLQVGGDLIWLCSPRLSVGGKTKLGGYINKSEGFFHIRNADVVVLDNCDKSTELAFMAEAGLYARYQLRPRVHVTVGYEVWYLEGVALAREQTDFLIGPSTGTVVSNDEHALIHGGTAGIEIRW